METNKAGKYRFICFTADGKKVMETLTQSLGISERSVEEESLSGWTGEHFHKGNILVFIGAVGIAVRAIAPCVRDKATDPGVIVIDEQGRYVIPILSGHLGGATEAAGELASVLDAIPVITTATDLRGEFAVDVFASQNNLKISNMKRAKEFTAKLLAGEDAVFTVSPMQHDSDELFLIPECMVVGMGCRKGKSCDELYDFLTGELDKNGIDRRSLKALASIDIKKDEPGLKALAERLEIPFETYSAGVLMEQEGNFESSDFAMSVTGADNICERAVMAYGAEKIVVHKTARDGMTLAIGMQIEITR